ncbi:MAG: head GIN domain-containing protein [Saprospiraceae bacterium]
MKTSNKILTTVGAIILTFILAALIYAKNNFSNTQIKANGVHKMEDKTLETFKSIDITGNFDVEIKSGSPSIKIEGDEEIIKNLNIQVSDSKLIVEMKKNNWNFESHETTKLTISTNELNGIRSVGNSDIASLNDFSSESFNVSQLGNGEIITKQNSTTIDVELTGNGTITNNGKAEMLNVKLLGNGEVDFYNTDSKSASISLTGNGTAKVKCSEKLHTNLLGNGEIYYKGKPSLDINKTGNGDVIEDNE